MKEWPLRWQLACLTAALVGVVLASAGAAASWHLYRQGIADLDHDLRYVARHFFHHLPKEREFWDFDSHAQVRNLLPLANHLYVIEVDSGVDGTPLYSSDELSSERLPHLGGDGQIENTIVAGRYMRVGEFHEHELILRVGMGVRALREARADSLRGYLIAGPIILLVVAVGGWWIARRALSPIASIAASAEQITAQRLNQRLPVPPAKDELRRLTSILNHMMDRLEASFRQAMRFTSDASHELKTPLTIIRGELESALRRGGFSPAQERLLVNLLEETERLSRITEGLLLLSRADAGYLRLQSVQMDLAELLRDLMEDVEILAAPTEISIAQELPETAPLFGDPNFLRQLLLNLLDNAIKYNVQGGRVQVRLEQQGDHWLVTVGNTGAGVAADDREHLFDRFYRGDVSRDGRRAGHGLGLSICREIARAHGGEIRLHAAYPGWTEFRVELPLTPKPAASLPGAEVSARAALPAAAPASPER